MTRIRARIARLEAMDRARGDLELTPEEQAALAAGEAGDRAVVNRAMLKAVSRYGLEALILGSYAPRPPS